MVDPLNPHGDPRGNEETKQAERHRKGSQDEGKMKALVSRIEAKAWQKKYSGRRNVLHHEDSATDSDE